MKQCLEYRPEIDGLRGVSILLVVIYHFFPKALTGGFIGVDIFFVISGFLITGISKSRYRDESWSTLSFYSARIRRLFPSLLLVIGFSLFIGWFSLLPSEYLGLGRHAKAGLGFFENFALSRESGYFGEAIGFKPLAHIWSLSIEEQFYLMFPLLVLFTKGWERHGVKTMSIILLGSLLTNLYRAYIDPSDIYLAPAARCWELMSGAVLSLLLTKTPPKEGGLNRQSRILPILVELLAICGLLLMVIPAFWISETTIFPGWPATLPVIGALITIHLGSRSRLIRGVLTNRPIILIGLISYPLYLWHWVLRSFLLLELGLEPSFLSRCLTLLMSGLIAYACYRWVEAPFRKTARQGFATALLLAGAVIVALAASLIVGAKGFPNRFPEHVDNAEIIEESYPSEWRLRSCLLKGSQTPDNLGDECVTDPLELADTAKHDIKVLLWGDSYAAHLYPGLKSFQNAEAKVTQINMVACFPGKGFRSKNSQNCWMLYDFVISHLAQHHYDLVILAANWESYGRERIEGDFISTLKELNTVSPNNVVIFGPPPRWSMPLGKLMAKKYHRFNKQEFPERLSDGLSQETFELDQRMERIVTAQNMGYISIVGHLCDHNGCLVRRGPKLMSVDEGHLSLEASHLLFDSLKDLTGRHDH